MITSPAFWAAALVFAGITAAVLFVVRNVALSVVASSWQKGTFIPLSLGLRAARVKQGEPLLASLPAKHHPRVAGAAPTRGLLVITPSMVSFQSTGTRVDVPHRAIRHLTVLRNGHLDIRTDGTAAIGALAVPNPAAVAQMIQASFRHPRA